MLEEMGKYRSRQKVHVRLLASSPFTYLQWTWWQKGISSFRYLILEAKNTVFLLPTQRTVIMTMDQRLVLEQTDMKGIYLETGNSSDHNEKLQWSSTERTRIKAVTLSSVMGNGCHRPQTAFGSFSTNQEHLYRILEAFSIHSFCHIPRKRNNAFREKADWSVAKLCEMAKSCCYEIS